MIGSTVGDYRITGKLGEGGFGVVFRAVHRLLEQEVAIKTMDLLLTRDAKFRSRFFEEAKAQAKLRHPNIVTIHNFFEHEGQYYIVMELLDGLALPDGTRAGTLAELLKRGPLPEERTLAIFGQLLGAVGAAHRQGILHRDLKPLNILFSADGTAKIADFGIAKIVGGDTNVSVSGTRVGTPAYMSPEQVLNKPLDRRTDIYSLGITLYEMLCGELPFAATPTTSMEEQHLYAAPPPIRQRCPAVPATLEAVVGRALAKKPEERFASCEEFAAALRAVGAAERPRPAEPERTVVETGRGRRLPDLTGMKPAEAETVLASRGLRLRVAGTEKSESVYAGLITRQVPGPGAEPDEDKTVKVIVSRERTKAKAWPFIVAAVAVALVVTGIVAFGRRQSPAAPAAVTPPTQQTFVVPNLQGFPLSQAQSRLSQSGLVALVRDSSQSDAVATGAVLALEPRPGTGVRRGDTVRLSFSLGRATCANCGAARSSARAKFCTKCGGRYE
jgi:serine/threonine-protein kinase